MNKVTIAYFVVVAILVCACFYFLGRSDGNMEMYHKLVEEGLIKE